MARAGPGRVLVYPPTHPALAAAYIVVGVIVSLLASSAIGGLVAYWAGLGSGILVAWLLASSPVLSFFNIVVGELRVPNAYRAVVEMEYVVVYGIPVPVPRVRVVEATTLLAINVGGALVPAITALILLVAASQREGVPGAALAGVTVTALVTYRFSRVVEGVGIVVPALIPPLTGALVSVLLLGPGPEAAAVAYASGVYGSLLGADVLRLLRDLGRINAPVVSIGGAGVFDGVFLSGVLASLLAG